MRKKHQRLTTEDSPRGLTRRQFVTDVAFASAGLALLPAISRGATSTSTDFDFYIGPNGVDSNPGTQSAPWSISSLGTTSGGSGNANAAKIAGKRVGLLPGTYVLPAPTNAGGGYGYYINIGAAGTSAAPTVIQATVPRQAILTMWNGSSFLNTAFRASALWLSGPYINLVGLAFDKLNTGSAVNCRASNLVIDSCSVTNLDCTALFTAEGTAGDNTAAIYLQEVGDPLASGLLITNCYFNGIYNQSGSPAYSFNSNAISGFQFTDVTIQFCECVNTHSLFYPKGKCGYYTVTNNFVHDCACFMRDIPSAFPTYNAPVASAPYCTIANNIAWNVTCIAGGYFGNPGQVDHLIYNNTFCMTAGTYGCNWQIPTYSSDPVYGSSPQPTSSKFFNNIIFDMTAASQSWITFHFMSGGNGGVLPYNKVMTSMDYNCFSDHGSDWFVVKDDALGQTWSSLAAWQTASGFETHSVQADPMFASSTPSSPADFQLQSGSPCKGIGRVGGVASGAVTDIGAWGNGGVPVTRIGTDFGSASGSVTPQPPTLTVS